MRRPVRRLIAAGVVLAAIAGCGDTAEVDRSLTEEAFLETCAPGRTPLEERVCRCAFEQVTEGMSAAELERLDQNLRDDPEDVPPEVTEAALDCASEPLTPITQRPTTTTSTTERQP